MELRDFQVYVVGPVSFLQALFREVAAGIERGHSCYMGIIEGTGAGSGAMAGEYDRVRLQIRDKVKPEDARTIVNLALDRIAEQHGLLDERRAVTTHFPDDQEEANDNF